MKNLYQNFIKIDQKSCPRRNRAGTQSKNQGKRRFLKGSKNVDFLIALRSARNRGKICLWSARGVEQSLRGIRKGTFSGLRGSWAGDNYQRSSMIINKHGSKNMKRI